MVGLSILLALNDTPLRPYAPGRSYWITPHLKNKLSDVGDANGPPRGDRYQVFNWAVGLALNPLSDAECFTSPLKGWVVVQDSGCRRSGWKSLVAGQEHRWEGHPGKASVRKKGF